MMQKGLKIIEVEAGSAAEEAGLKPGDEILTVNGHCVPDELALQFSLSDECIEMHIRKAGGKERTLEIDLSDPVLGVQVEPFRTRTCNNACLFCFVDQLPPNVRKTLRVKDDDYRLSFLHGNYITLTNLRDRDLDRIIEHRLSPLYVSVHATDPELRTRMLGRKKADDLGRKLNKLIRGGIRIHAQIVLMPQVNDGSNLEKTIHDLYRHHPGVQSVAVVPLGLSNHGTIKDRFAPVTPAFSRALINQATPWQERFRQQTGSTFVYLADEFYIQSGMEMPGTEHYDDYAQIEDGIGMVRNFLDEFDSAIRRRRRSLAGLNGTVTTGRLFFPTLSRCMKQFNSRFGASIRVIEVKNRFMGSRITVAGLLAGVDFLKALNKVDLGSFVIIPQEAVSRVDGILLDDLSPADLGNKLGVQVYPGGHTVQDFFGLLFKLNRR
jgi:putative radical SAM enzyme (TIGR03279 family)